MSPVELGDPEIVVLQETTSTNDVVYEMALRGAKKAIVFAETQTAGRGQHGKRWESPAGQGLWFSVLLRERIAPNESSRVTRRAAEAIAEVINEQLSLGATVKEPNDVYAHGRKIAGVLLELRAIPHAEHAAILGVGVNVNQTRDDFPPELRETASSLRLLSGEHINRTQLARALLQRLLLTG